MPTLIIRGVPNELQGRAEQLGAQVWALLTQGEQCDWEALLAASELLEQQIDEDGTFHPLAAGVNDGFNQFVAAVCLESGPRPTELLAMLREMAQYQVTLIAEK